MAGTETVIEDVFQSTLPLRGVTWRSIYILRNKAISIHTPLAGSDHTTQFPVSSPQLISIHTPLAGSDWEFLEKKVINDISIHTPLAGSDSDSQNPQTIFCDFNPHSPCGE